MAKKHNPYLLTAYEIQKIKNEATKSAIDTAMVLLFSIPIKVGREKYDWTDEEMETFVSDVADEYEKFQGGELTLNELRDYVYEHCGVKFECYR